MSADEYLSSPIKQSQRAWCEGNVVLMSLIVPAHRRPDRGPLSGASLLSTHLGRALLCGRIFVLSSLSRSSLRPLIDPPFREN